MMKELLETLGHLPNSPPYQENAGYQPVVYMWTNYLNEYWD
jgi:hypothetical protein